MNLVVVRTRRRNGIGCPALLAALWNRLDEKTGRLRVINVDQGDAAMLRFLRRSGFETFARQYEMDRLIQDADPR